MLPTRATLATVVTAGMMAALLYRRVRTRRARKLCTQGVVFTGTGCSAGTPLPRCLMNQPTTLGFKCRACKIAARNGPSDPNYRGNVSMLIRFENEEGRLVNIQIDMGKYFRDSALLRIYPRLGVSEIDALVLTHDHADATFGLDDVRMLQPFNKVKRVCERPIVCRADRRTVRALRRSFPYLFSKTEHGLLNSLICSECGVEQPNGQSSTNGIRPTPAGPATAGGKEVKRFVAAIDWHTFPEDTSCFDVCGLQMRALPVLHGSDYTSYGFAFGPERARVVYISDYTELLPDTEALLASWRGEIELMVLDALMLDEPRPTHACVRQSIDLVRRYRPRKALLVGMLCEMEHHETNRMLRRLLPDEGLDVQLAFDGQYVPLDALRPRPRS